MYSRHMLPAFVLVIAALDFIYHKLLKTSYILSGTVGFAKGAYVAVVLLLEEARGFVFTVVNMGKDLP